MPDGDILRLGIHPQFCTPYENMCDDVSPDACAHALSRGLASRINWYGEGPVDLLKAIEPAIAALAAKLDRPTPGELVQLDRMIELQRQQVSGRAEGLDIAVGAARRVVNSLAQGGLIGDIGRALASHFVDDVLACSYDSIVQAIPNHYNGISSAEIARRRQAIDTHLGKFVQSFKRQLMSHKPGRKMRLAPSRRLKLKAQDVVE